MATANVVDVSEYQPTTIDFEDLKNQGIKAVIVRLGHGTTQDKNAASHIARATAAGLIVHGYHFYEGKDGEIVWSLKNAQNLGLATSAYYFLDMEGDIAGSWPDIFRSFYRNWLQAGYHVGLYCSLSKYSLFDDKEMTTNDIYRWIADWDVDAAPSVADVWQYNCSTGLGLYQDKLDKDVDIAGKLVETIEPTSHVTNPDEDYEVTAGAFVGFDYSTTAVTGGKFLVASPDGKNKIPKLSPDGHFFFNKTDGDNMWALIKPHTNEPVSWNDVTDKPNVVTQDDLKNIESATSTATTQTASAVSAASQAQITANTANSTATVAQSAASQAQSTADTANSAAQVAQNTANNAESRAESAYSLASTASSDAKAATQVSAITSGTLADLANKQGVYHYEIDFIPSDSPAYNWGMCDVVVSENYAKEVFTDTSTTDVYVRTRKSESWSEWRQITLWN